MPNGQYFSERQGGEQPRDQDEISQNFWQGFIALVEARLADGSFAETFPDNCFEAPVPIGSNNENVGQATRGEHPDIEWPLQLAPLPPTPAVIDLVQFFHRIVSRPTVRRWHDYGRHHHLVAFDPEAGKAEYRETVNRLFRRNRHPYEIRQNGEVCRLQPPVLGEVLAQALFRTGDDELDRMLNQARERFCSPDPVVRKESLERLWGAWERLKTLYPGDKRASTESLLAAAIGEQVFRERVEAEARELTNIGNSFMIRHTETNKTPIDSEQQVDYLFHRLFALIWLLLRETGRLH